jgi:hypothetical protein
MALKAIQVPSDKAPLDDNGKIKLDWQQFFTNLEKKPGAHIDDLSGSSDPQREAVINSILQILRDNKLIDDNS